MPTTFQSVPDMLLYRVAQTPQKEAFRYPQGAGWKSVNYGEFGEQVREVAFGLRALGLKDEERVSLLSSTRYEWILADMGVLCAAGATTTIYPSSTAADCSFIIRDSGTTFVIAENDEQIAKLVEKRAELTSVRHVITFDGTGSDDGWVITFASLREKGRGKSPQDFEKLCRTVRSDSLATLMYTSGTTGRPKGVRLVHDCWVYEAEAIDAIALLRPDDLQYLWLPLSHVFGKVLEVSQLRIGFSTAVDGRVDRLVENLSQVRPTFVAAVPRIFEKVYNKVVGGAKQGGGLKYSIFKWATGVGKEASAARQRHQTVGGALALKNAIANKLVFSKLQERFGGRLRFFVSGSAPLSREMAEFFHAFGILILEGYGLTETSAATCVNRPDSFKFGSVGPAFPGTQIKIAADGEILVKGRGVMRGYHGLPEATAEVIKDGWFHTGDIGELDANGLLRITDRKKDLIKTSGGKYVAPQALEGKLKAMCPYIGNVLVHGNNRNFCTALVAVDPEAIATWAKDHGVPGGYAELVQDARVHQLIEPFVDQLNATLANYEQIKKFAILPKDLTLESDDLTPSLKLKRKAVEAKYQSTLDGFYGASKVDV